jgi:hypothetical protein
VLRLDIHDGVFRDEVSESPTYYGVIVNAASISRSYYEGNYDPDRLNIPTCWSSDTQVPSPNVPKHQRQSARCMDCKYNIRGSGYGSSRACRFAQRLAILPQEDMTTVYQLRLPATSIFGQAREGNLPLQAYARFLKNMDTAPKALVTQMYFDRHSTTPKLFFKAERPLTEEELSVTSGMVDNVDTIRAITLEFTPYSTTNISPFPEVDGFQST